MSRGGSYGGGQSSLGYLFGSDNQQEGTAPPPSPIVSTPPYGTDTNIENPPKILLPAPPKDKNVSNNYQRAEGQNSGNFLTVSHKLMWLSFNCTFFRFLFINTIFYFQGRPSTKVKSVPGGDSSLGYLFGDKWFSSSNVENSLLLNKFKALSNNCILGLNNMKKGLNSHAVRVYSIIYLYMDTDGGWTLCVWICLFDGGNTRLGFVRVCYIYI